MEELYEFSVKCTKCHSNVKCENDDILNNPRLKIVNNEALCIICFSNKYGYCSEHDKPGKSCSYCQVRKHMIKKKLNLFFILPIVEIIINFYCYFP